MKRKKYIYKLPRLSCSISMAVNKDLKFPAPKPCKYRMEIQQLSVYKYIQRISFTELFFTYVMIVTLNNFQK